jgi:hypothetical protein
MIDVRPHGSGRTRKDSLVAESFERNETPLVVVLADGGPLGLDAGSAKFDQVFMVMFAVHLCSPLEIAMAMTTEE